MPGTNTRYTLPDWVENLSFEHALKLLLYGAFGENAPNGTGLPVSPGGGSGTDNVNLAQVGAVAVTLGSKTSAASIPVVIASDQGGVPVTVTGVATAANQATQITAEQAILAKIIAAPATEAKQPALGTQATPSADVITVINSRPTLFTNRAANATLNVKATAGNVFSISCNNANAATRYLQLHNTATVPAGGAAPVFSFPVYSGGTTIIGTDYFTTAGVNFSTGIAFAFSTTRDTYTAGSSTEQSTEILYL